MEFIHEASKEISQASEAKLKDLAELLRAIAHPIRLKILCHLSKGDKCVVDLERVLGKEQAVISQQLKVLRFSGLVNVRRENNYSFYSLNPEKKEALKSLVGGLCHMMK